jgi:hypothetical protein
MGLPNSALKNFWHREFCSAFCGFSLNVPSNFVINRVASKAINNLIIKVKA